MVTSLLGTFYRSASLYHPQRRAILHLKSQKRKIKGKDNKSKDKDKSNKAQQQLPVSSIDDSPPLFDFTTLRSRTIQITLGSVAIGSLGINAPIFYLVRNFPYLLAVAKNRPVDSLFYSWSHKNQILKIL